MLLTPRFGCTIKQFSNCDFSYKTIICTHILNSLKYIFIVLEELYANISI